MSPSGLDCSGRSDASSPLRELLSSTTAPAVYLPAGCRLLLASPGPGGTAVVLPSQAQIVCEDGSAGFRLSRVACTGGDAAGAACTEDADCPGGGSCRSDLPGRPAFAHRVCREDSSISCLRDTDCASGDCRVPEAPFTVFGTEPGARSISISGCSIDVNQRSHDIDTDRLFGTCLGGAADGRPCSQLCSKPPPRIQIACEADEDCERVAAGKCVHAELCSQHPEAPGRCLLGGPTGYPAGPGSINVIDLGATIDGSVADVRIYDHVFGDFAVALGSAGRLLDSGIGLARVAGPTGIFVGSGYYGRPLWERKEQFVAVGVVSGQGATISGTSIRGGDVAVRIAGPTTLSQNHIECSDRGGWSTTYCAEDEDSHPADRPPCRTDTDCATTCRTEPPDCIGILVDSSQNRILDNQVEATFIGLASTVRGFNTLVSDNRFYAGSGPKLSIQGAGWQITGNYFAWGTRAENGAVLQIGAIPGEGSSGSSDHILLANNIVHGGSEDEHRGLSLIALVDAGTTGSHRRTLLANNLLVLGPQQTGIDLSDQDTGRLEGTALVGNSIEGGEIGIRFPQASGRARGLVVTANAFDGTARPLEDWDWSMGTAMGNAPLSHLEDAVSTVYLKTGKDREILAGQAVVIAADETGSGVVVPAPKGAKHIAGIALGGAGADSVVQIATSGTTQCMVATGAIGAVQAGGALAVDAGGRFLPTQSEIIALATALESVVDEGRIRCLLH